MGNRISEEHEEDRSWSSSQEKEEVDSPLPPIRLDPPSEVLSEDSWGFGLGLGMSLPFFVFLFVYRVADHSMYPLPLLQNLATSPAKSPAHAISSFTIRI